MKSKASTLLECHHCHQPVTDAVVSENGKHTYCCYGCKVVDELLHSRQGVADKSLFNTAKYAYLDEPKIRKSLIQFEDGSFARIAIHLPAIHCSSCIYLLENLTEIEEGILEVQVHFAKKQADISFRPNAILLSEVAALLDYIGYTPDFQTKLGSEKKKRNLLLIQLGVAGFFFGNTMLLALPEYFDKSLSADTELQQFFRYMMMAFSIPVVLFSGRDYFTNTFKTLRAGILSIDLPIALGLFVLFIRSAYEVISGTGAGFFDSLNGLVFFLLIGKWYQQKTYQNFTFDRDFRSFIPLAANLLLKNGKEKPIAVDDLQKGDLIVVRQGEVLSADALLKSPSAEVDYSYITGESIPVQKTAGDSIYAGARIAGAAAQLEVQTKVDRSYLSSLWNNEAFKGETKKSRGLTDRISQYFTPAIIIIALISAGIWSIYDTQKAITVFAAVLIVACPCALALAEPFASGSMMRWFGRNGLFLKNAEVLNRLHTINHLVFDKTGTLTRQDTITVQWTGDELVFAEKLAIASIAKNAQHPLAKPLLAHLQMDFADANQAVDFTEASGEGVTARVQNHIYRMGKASFLQLHDNAKTTAVYVEKDGETLGYFSFFQQTREETAEVLSSLSSSYQVSLLSGDNDAEKRRFEEMLGSKATLMFNQSPHQKLQYLKDLQLEGGKVLMIGDGLNDAGALQQSEVGISLCEKNVNFFPASDALLLAESFGKLDQFVHLSYLNKKIIKQAFALSFTYNIIGLSFAVAGVLSPLVCAILMPVSSISVVLFTTLATQRACKIKLTL
jgi:Cu+-exporting ATPase